LRRLLVVLACLLLAQASGLGSLVAGVGCAETCPDDVTPGRCPPVCASCACTGHAFADLPRPASATAAGPAGEQPLFEARVASPERPVSDVFHVPLLA